MKKVALIVCAFFFFAYGRNIENDIPHSRVIKGEAAKVGERPFQVSLYDAYEHFCGGSIVNEYWVVTSAYCVQGYIISTINVIVGTVSLKEPYSSHKSHQIILHKEWAPSDSSKNDIALIKVAIPFKFSHRVQPVALPEAHAKVKTNSSAVLSGWGRLDDLSKTNVLQKATIFIADPEYCRVVIKERGLKIYPTNVCANDPSTRRGPCYGDKGGPLTVDGKLIGIVSWWINTDPDCGSKKYPGVYTRVPEYIDWIHEHIK